MIGIKNKAAIRIFVFALALAVLTVPVPVRADAMGRASVERIAALFEEVVFGSEIDPKLASTVVAKWQEPIRLAIQGRHQPRHLEFLYHHAAILAGLTGLSIEPAKPGETANITVAFVPRAQMGKIQIGGVSPDLIRQLAGPGGCYFVSWQKPPGRVIGAVIVANTERDIAEINHCLLEELTQSLGMPNDADVLRPSIFSDHDKLTELSRTDRIVVRTLYDSRLKAGTPKADALRAIPAIIRELSGNSP